MPLIFCQIYDFAFIHFVSSSLLKFFHYSRFLFSMGFPVMSLCWLQFIFSGFSLPIYYFHYLSVSHQQGYCSPLLFITLSPNFSPFGLGCNSPSPHLLPLRWCCPRSNMGCSAAGGLATSMWCAGRVCFAVSPSVGWPSPVSRKCYQPTTASMSRQLNA